MSGLSSLVFHSSNWLETKHDVQHTFWQIASHQICRDEISLECQVSEYGSHSNALNMGSCQHLSNNVVTDSIGGWMSSKTSMPSPSGWTSPCFMVVGFTPYAQLAGHLRQQSAGWRSLERCGIPCVKKQGSQPAYQPTLSVGECIANISCTNGVTPIDQCLGAEWCLRELSTLKWKLGSNFDAVGPSYSGGHVLLAYDLGRTLTVLWTSCTRELKNIYVGLRGEWTCLGEKLVLLHVRQ